MFTLDFGLDLGFWVLKEKEPTDTRMLGAIITKINNPNKITALLTYLA